MGMENEVWRDIEGYEGLYQASSFGRIRNFRGRILKQFGNRYYSVKFYKNGSNKTIRVAKLVFEAFNGKIPEGFQINHIDENTFNNNIENLNLLTPSQNNRWGTRIERALNTRRKNNSYGAEKPVQQMTKDGFLINSFKSVCQASRQTGICSVSIRNVCNNKPHYITAGGYKWKYLN